MDITSKSFPYQVGLLFPHAVRTNRSIVGFRELMILHLCIPYSAIGATNFPIGQVNTCRFAMPWGSCDWCAARFSPVTLHPASFMKDSRPPRQGEEGSVRLPRVDGGKILRTVISCLSMRNDVRTQQHNMESHMQRCCRIEIYIRNTYICEHTFTYMYI